MAFIRPFRKSDFEATAHICRETLRMSPPPETLWRLAPYLFTHQYTFLSPDTCFVLDDGTGAAVGYCIGCPDVVAFADPDAYDSYVKEILEPSTEIHLEDGVDLTGEAGERLPWVVDGEFSERALAQTAYSGHWLVLDGNEDLVEEEKYRATMHIDLLEGWQGKGWGRKLIDAFVGSVRGVEMGDGVVSKGVWIAIGLTNERVVPFYEKMGFKLKKREGKDHVIAMVRDY